MTLQNTLDNQAIDMLIHTREYISSIDSYRASHHHSVAVRKINDSEIALDDMTSIQLNQFDIAVCNYLKSLDKKGR